MRKKNFSTNSVRLWSPQIFDAAIENENAAVNSSFLSNACDLLISNSDEKMSEEMENCQEHTVDYRVYFNLVIAGVVAGVISSAASYGVKYLDKKWLLSKYKLRTAEKSYSRFN